MQLPRRETMQMARLRAMYAPVFMAGWYLKRYPDVVNSELDPLDHFVAQGEKEGRDPSPYFKTMWVATQFPGRSTEHDQDRPLSRFLSTPIRSGIKPHPCIDPVWILAQRPELSEAAALLKALDVDDTIDHTSEWFSRREYATLYPDLANVEYLEDHFLSRGIVEERRPRSSYRVVERQEFLRGSARACKPVDSFAWDGSDFVVISTGPGKEILQQVMSQAALDPRICSAGVNAIAALPTFLATDLGARDLIDVDGLIRLAQSPYDAVIVLPGLGLGGAEKYLSQVAHVLDRRLEMAVLVLATDVAQDQVDELARTVRKGLLGRVDTVALRDLVDRTWKADQILALLLLAIGPKLIIVANSEIGFACISKYGKALSNYSHLVACFFSESPFAIGSPYSARFADALPAGSSIWSDNAAVQEQLGQRLDRASGWIDFAVVPQYVESADGYMVLAEVALRSSRWARSRAKRVLWISRWDRFKNTESLKRAAALRPTDSFDVFGPSTESLTSDGIPNIKGHGPVWDLARLDLSEYDCFLFTSQFEGMPNVVLEMVARQIPVVAPRVGGLTETFSDNGITFYANGSTQEETAIRINAALATLFSLEESAMRRRCVTAADELWERHSFEGFVERLRRATQDVASERLSHG